MMLLTRFILFGLMYMFFYPFIFAQNDTIFLSENRYRVINTKEVIESDTDIDSVKFLTEEFSEYTTDGILVGSRKFFGKNHFLTVLFNDDGVKRFEKYNNLIEGTYYEISWNEFGDKQYQIFINENSKVVTYYYPREKIQKIIDVNLCNYHFDHLKVKSNDHQMIAIEKEISDSTDHKKELIIEFFENGQIKSEKSFIYKAFDLYELDQQKKTKDEFNELTLIGHIEKIRIGVWKYYHPDGSVNSKENYSEITFESISK